MTQGRKLEAPHRRLESTPPRIVERAAIVGYRSAAAAPRATCRPALSRAVIATASQAQLPRLAREAAVQQRELRPRARAPARASACPAHGAPRVQGVRALPGRAHAPAVAPARGAAWRASRATASSGVAQAWRDSGQAMIVVAGHVGNNEAVAAAIAEARLPGQRHRRRLVVPGAVRAPPPAARVVGRPRHPVAQPARAVQRCSGARRSSRLLVDWGYRSDGVPVRLFGSWTTLPAGPATLAAKTGAIIAPLAIRRDAAGTFRIEGYEAFTVAVLRARGHPARDPADRRLPRGHRRRRPGAVVQLQADVARHRRGGAELEAAPPRCSTAGLAPGPRDGAREPSAPRRHPSPRQAAEAWPP